MRCSLCREMLTATDVVVVTFQPAEAAFTANMHGACLRGFVGSKQFYALQAEVVKLGWVQESLPF